jgi:WD40 repeat protein
VESGDTILEPIVTKYEVWAAVYSPDVTLIATGGHEPFSGQPQCSVQIWDAKTGELVATLKGHTIAVRCLAWTKDGKTLISGSYDNTIRTWNTTKWERTAVLDGHSGVYAIAISPNGRILASALFDMTARLWNLDDGQPISSPLQHADGVRCVSFSAGGKRLVTGCLDKNAYSWDVALIIREAGLDDLLLDSKVRHVSWYCILATKRALPGKEIGTLCVIPSLKDHVVLNIDTPGRCHTTSACLSGTCRFF